MDKFLVDTNILIRFIVEDEESKYESFVSLINKLENNEITLIIPTMVIAECCWLLKSFYKLSKIEISNRLIEICEVVNIVPEETIILSALKIFTEKNVDFTDALLSVKSFNNNIPVITWDKKDFRKLECEYYSPEEIT